MDDEAGRWARYCRWVLGPLLGLLCLVALTNAVLDPYAAYRVVELPALGPYRQAFEGRIARAEILEHERCELVILGTSRAQVALDPRHPAWERPACNLSVTGAGIAEIRAVARRALGHPEVRELFWTLDFLSFRSDLPPHPELRRSRFDPALRPLEYHAGLLLGAGALRASWRLLRDYRDDEPSPFDSLGMTDLGAGGRGRSARQRFVWALEHDVQALAVGRPFVYDPGSVTEMLREIRAAAERGVLVTLVILPSHVLHQESLDRFGQWEVSERWRADLARALETAPGSPALWDCTSYAGAAAEPLPEGADTSAQMRWHWDSVHIRAALGAVVIEQIRGRGAQAGGALSEALCAPLRGDTVESHLARIAAEREAYRRAGSPDLELLRQAEGQVLAAATPDR